VFLTEFTSPYSTPRAILNTLRIFILKDTDFVELSCTKLRDKKAQNLFIPVAEKLEFHFLLVWTRLQKQESVSDTKLMAEVMSVFNPFKNEVNLNTI